MRKLLLCVPMMALLLTACGGGAGASEGERLALAVRGEYLGMDACTAQIALTADYGQRFYEYEMTAAVEGGETVMVLTAPETVAGCTARMSGEDSALEYDGIQVETGPMDDRGLTPLSAFPQLLEAARSGYITACALDEEEGTLRIDCGDPEGAPGSGTETALWFDVDTHALVRGEISVDGACAVSCRFSSFTWS